MTDEEIISEKPSDLAKVKQDSDSNILTTRLEFFQLLSSLYLFLHSQ